MALHPNHEKNRDAHYWYGGVMFKQKKYEDSAFSDIEFNDKYPDDPRTVDTTLRIAILRVVSTVLGSSGYLSLNSISLNAESSYFFCLNITPPYQQ